MKTPKTVALVAAAIAAVWVGVLVSTVTVLVRQEPSVPLALGMSSWSAAADSDTASLPVSSSQPWTATGDAPWLTAAPASGTRSATVLLVAAPNTTASDRSATLTVTSAGVVQTVTVRQGAPRPQGMLDLDVTDWDVAVEGGTTALAVTGGQPWTAGTDVGWVSVQADAGAGTLTLAATANVASDPRSALVTVSDGTTSITVTVNQAGQVEATLTLSASRWSPGAGAVSSRVSVASDHTWAVTSDESWASVDPESGTGDGTFTIRVTKNTSTRARTATVRVVGGGMTRAVYVVQAGVPRSTPVPSPTSPSPSPNSPSSPADPPANPPVNPPVDPPDNPPVDPPDNPPVDPPDEGTP